MNLYECEMIHEIKTGYMSIHERRFWFKNVTLREKKLSINVFRRWWRKM